MSTFIIIDETFGCVIIGVHWSLEHAIVASWTRVLDTFLLPEVVRDYCTPDRKRCGENSASAIVPLRIEHWAFPEKMEGGSVPGMVCLGHWSLEFDGIASELGRMGEGGYRETIAAYHEQLDEKRVVPAKLKDSGMVWSDCVEDDPSAIEEIADSVNKNRRLR